MELAKNNFLCFYVFVFVFTVIYSNILVLSNFKKKCFEVAILYLTKRENPLVL